MTANITMTTTNKAVAIVKIAPQGNWRAIPTIARMPMAAWKSDSFIICLLISVDVYHHPIRSGMGGGEG